MSHPQAAERSPTAGSGWQTLSRWEMTWRVLLAGVAVSTLAVLILDLAVALDPTKPVLVGGATGWAMALGLPLLFGGLTALFGPRMRRLAPVAQALLFGVLGFVLAVVGLTVWALIESAIDPCVPGTGCWGASAIAVILGVFYAPIVFVVACLSYPVAIWSVRRPGGLRAIWIVAALLLAILVVVTVVMR